MKAKGWQRPAAPETAGGDTGESARQERQEFLLPALPARGTRTQVEQVQLFSAAITPPG